MFQRRNRFSFKKGVPRKIFQIPLFVLRYEYNNENVFHCAVVVGKKVDKKAVVRNKLKRQLVLSIKNILSSNNNISLVVYARKGLLNANKDEIDIELSKAFKTTKILS